MINNLCYECIFYLTNAASKAAAAAANAAALTPPQRHRMGHGSLNETNAPQLLTKYIKHVSLQRSESNV